MGSLNFLWSLTKKTVFSSLIAVTISDRYASFVPVRGHSMSPTFNAGSTGDLVLVEKFCLSTYKFSHGDVITFRSPSNHRQIHIKRLIALPGDWIQIPESYEIVKIPEGHCWVEGNDRIFLSKSRKSLVPHGPVSSFLSSLNKETAETRNTTGLKETQTLYTIPSVKLRLAGANTKLLSYAQAILVRVRAEWMVNVFVYSSAFFLFPSLHLHFFSSSRAS
ncbi:hypothetical protein H6P81_006883 [Aristolochia fimbriata]|uniref:Mitochondrial inner membrane protease subunit 2 n=1 Tax=Aristolochia fimbriata TaxID=158543 RepID=A0AAV7EZQ8_ARIFI|nr:hypothetical protein H6P81_006883 [Aristolochia fimbriata]